MRQLGESARQSGEIGATRVGMDDEAAGPIGRACDQCHARKVKCDGQSPCSRCQRGSVSCSFKNPVRPKGPAPRRLKTGRARVGAQPYSTSSRPPVITSPVQPQTLLNDAISDLESPLSLDKLLQIDWLAEIGSGISNDLTTGSIQLIDPDPTPPDKTDSVPNNQAMVLSRPTSRLGSRRNSSSNIFSTMPNYDIHLPSSFGFLQSPFVPFPPQPAFPEPSLFPLPSQSSSTPSPLLVLTLETLILPALSAFFTSVYPMIPVIPQSYIYPRLYTGLSHSFATLVLCMAALALVHPREPDLALHATKYRQATALLDEATRLRGWSFGSAPTVEDVLASYLMFGALFELGHAGGARMRLIESVVLGQNMRLGDTTSYAGLDSEEVGRRVRMYWVLAVTERAYALQRSGSIVFRGPISIPRLVPEAQVAQPSSLSLLARVFSYIDQDILVCWAGCTPATCKLTAKRANHILSALSGSAADVFGNETELAGLSESQKADLLVTWQWLRNRLWRIAAAHGFVGEAAAAAAAPGCVDKRKLHSQLSVDYVVDVASTTLAICKRLSPAAMDSHGTGFVEKLYDIASIATDLLGLEPPATIEPLPTVEDAAALDAAVSAAAAAADLDMRLNELATVPTEEETDPMRKSLVHVVRGEEWTGMMQEMYRYVTRHRAGQACGDKLAQAVALATSIKLVRQVEAS